MSAILQILVTVIGFCGAITIAAIAERNSCDPRYSSKPTRASWRARHSDIHGSE